MIEFYSVVVFFCVKIARLGMRRRNIRFRFDNDVIILKRNFDMDPYVITERSKPVTLENNSWNFAFMTAGFGYF